MWIEGVIIVTKLFIPGEKQLLYLVLITLTWSEYVYDRISYVEIEISRLFFIRLNGIEKCKLNVLIMIFKYYKQKLV